MHRSLENNLSLDVCIDSGSSFISHPPKIPPEAEPSLSRGGRFRVDPALLCACGSNCRTGTSVCGQDSFTYP